MRSTLMVATGIGLAALFVAGATGAEEKALGTRLVDQMNALYRGASRHSCQHFTGAVFEGTFTPAPGADGLSSAVFLKGPPTPLTIRFSNAGGDQTRLIRTPPSVASAAWRSSSVWPTAERTTSSASQRMASRSRPARTSLPCCGRSVRAGPTPPSPPRSTCSWLVIRPPRHFSPQRSQWR